MEIEEDLPISASVHIDTSLRFPTFEIPANPLLEQLPNFNEESVLVESKARLAVIRKGFASSVLASNIAPSLMHWIKQLNLYVDSKLQMPAIDRAYFIATLYNLIITPDQDTSFIQTASKLCTKLLKKRELLSPEMLQLPWKPLMKVIRKNMNPGTSGRVLPVVRQHIQSVLKLVELAKSYFPPKAPTEILEKVLSYYDPNNLEMNISVMSLLCIFLPTDQIPVPPPSISTGPKFFWLPTIFSLWTTVTNSHTFDATIFELLGSLAEDQVAYPGATDFNESQVQRVFSIAMDHLQLPVGSASTSGTNNGGGNTSAAAAAVSTGGSGAGAAVISAMAGSFTGNVIASHGQSFYETVRRNKFEMFAKFVVYTIYPDSPEAPKTSTLKYLKDLIIACESFFHPSNQGKWSWSLTSLVQYLVSEYVHRLKKESHPACLTPASLRLTSAQTSQFVLILRDVAFLSAFAKHPIIQMGAHSTLKYLAWLEPDLILPMFLERAYPALESLTETDRTISILSALSQLTFPLTRRSHFPQGAKHIVPLLQLALPGIDMNDPTKTLASITFISNTISQIPLFDLTTYPVPPPLAVKKKKIMVQRTFENIMNGMVDEGEMGEFVEVDLDLELENELVRSSTAGIEEWVTGFWDRVFRMFENLPENYASNSKKGSTEMSMIGFLLLACQTVLNQLSPELFESSMKKILNVVSSNVMPNASKAIGSLIAQFSINAPKETLKVFFTIARSKILEEISNDAGVQFTSISTVTGHPHDFAKMSDASLHWWQCIVNGSVLNGGVHLLEHRGEIMSLIRESLLKLNSAVGYRWAGKFVRTVVDSLVHKYIIETKSMKPELWYNKEYIGQSHRRWGEAVDVNDLGINWHIPTREELNFAEEVLMEIGKLAISNMNSLMKELSDGGSSVSRKKEIAHNFTKWITILRGLISCSALISGNNTDFANNNNATDDMYPKYDLPHIYALTDPSDPQYQRLIAMRAEFGEYLVTLHSFFQKTSMDEVDPHKALIKAVRKYLSERGADSSKVSNMEGFMKYRKSHTRNVPKFGNRSVDIVIPGVLLSNGVKTPFETYDRKAWSLHNLSKKPDSYPRSFYLIDLYQLYLKRILQNAYLSGPQPDLHSSLLSVITDLSVNSRFTVIRTLAQSAVKSAARNWPSAKHTIVPFSLDALAAAEHAKKDDSKEVNEVVADKMKGALYLLRSFNKFLLMDWSMKKPFMLNLTSIQELIRKTFLDFIVGVWENVLEYPVSESAKLLANAMLNRAIEVEVSFGVEKKEMIVNQLNLTIERLQTKAQSKVASNKEIHLSSISELLALNETGNLHWRFTSMSISFLEFLSTVQQPISAPLAKFVALTANNELPAVRKVATQTLELTLTLLKVRALREQKRVDKGLKTSQVVYSRAYKNKTKFPLPKDSAEAAQLASVVTRPILTAAEWETTLFLDSNTAGFLSWAKNHALKGSPSTNEWILPYNDHDSRSAIEELKTVLSDPNWWSTHFSYITQESSTHERGEHYNFSIQKLHETISILFEDSLLNDEKLKIIPQISDLLVKPDELSKQRAAAELLAGIVRGSINWNFNQVSKMWEWVIPLVQQAIASSTPETIAFWLQFLSAALSDRDPRRSYPLVQLILNMKLDPESQGFFAETKKLTITRQLISTYSWRILPLVATSDKTSLVFTYFDNFSHNYHQVRELIGASISSILTNLWNLSALDIQDALTKCSEAEGNGIELQPYNTNDWVSIEINRLLEQMKIWKKEPRDIHATSSKYGNARKTVLSWFAHALSGWRTSSVYPFVDQILPEILRMSDHEDSDLQILSAKVVLWYCNYRHTPHLASKVMTHLLNTLQHNGDNVMDVDGENNLSWHSKVKILPMLQIFFFRNMLVLDQSETEMLMNAVCQLLEDPQTEVRQLAAVTLSGLIRCSQRDAILGLKARFEKTLSLNKLPKRNKISSELFNEILIKRHSATLGLGALIQAFPYDVPSWMPEVLETLHVCTSDPTPIKTSAEKAFADFKRTHQDTWHEQQSLFTEEQRYMMSNVLTYNYFA
ncbi:hypothetical protein HK098_006555 [Nowakowskiella sp. JEL0407]|nr:hypothetical protein HK098_006555 [Nowakowskiella sp. JEL0407]